MSRYNIAINKPPKVEKPQKKTLKEEAKSFLQSARDLVRPPPTNPGGQDSSEFININRIQGGMRSPRGVPGDTGLQGSTGIGIYATGSGGIGINATGSGPGMSFDNQGNMGIGSSSDRNISMQGFNHTGDAIETNVPVSQFLTLTGPNGYRVMMPIRRLEYVVEHDTITINLGNQAGVLGNDIEVGKGRLGL